jgi:hypothetical protein
VCHFRFLRVASIVLPSNAADSLYVQGVVVKPALAIPFFTGVVVFIGNIISLKTSIQKWQETIVKKVLEQLEPLLDRFKPSLLKALGTVIDSAQALDKTLDKTRASAVDELSAVSPQVPDSPLASLAGPALSSIVEKMVKLKDSIDNNDLGAFSSSLVEMKNETSKAVAAVRQPRQSSSTGAITFRKLTETEMAVLLKSLWTTIRSQNTYSYVFIIIYLYIYMYIYTQMNRRQCSCPLFDLFVQRGARSLRSQHLSHFAILLHSPRPLLAVHLHRNRHLL